MITPLTEPSPVPGAFAVMITGLFVVVLNYLELLPGDGVNAYLFLGLALITMGFMMLTTYR